MASFDYKYLHQNIRKNLNLSKYTPAVSFIWDNV